MIANYYTLRLIAADLNRQLAGRKIAQIFTQQRDELVITCGDKKTEAHLVVSCEPSRNSLVLRDEYPRAKKNSVDLFAQIRGARLQEIQMHPFDRQITLQTDTEYRFVIQLYGSKANVLLLDGEAIQDAFLRRKDTIGKPLEEQRLRTIPKSLAVFKERLLLNHSDLRSTLKRVFPTFGTELVEEILFLTGLPPDVAASNLSAQEMETVFETSRYLQNLLTERPSPRIYYDGSVATTFSIIPLKHLGNLRYEEYDSIHAAVRTFLGASRKQEGYLQQRRLLKFSLQQTLTKAERALANMRDNEESRALAGQYETTGKLIMANLSLLDKGMTQIELENPFSTQREAQTISLDPSLPPSKNAERYFNKAKKIRRDLKEHADRKTELERRARTIGGLLEKLEQLDNPEGMKQFTASYHDLLASFGVKLESGSKTKREQEVPFRVFTVAGGFQVWAGKSGENNDLLTMKYAKPNDLWFHARGSSGSHVVLKIGTSKGTPSKLAIQQAAGIAAYYSKMKNAKLVPVAMTERKYVRKRKGASAGTVTLEREKTVFAEPHLPGQ